MKESKMIVCPECGGSGHDLPHSAGSHLLGGSFECSTCHGFGEIEETDNG